MAFEPRSIDRDPLLQRRRSSTDKVSLLAALAEELRTEKHRAQVAAEEMLHHEQLIEHKHSSFLAEQDRLARQRDRNNSEISNLRRKLRALQQELDEAQHVQGEEAQFYLDLLREAWSGPGPSQSEPSQPRGSSPRSFPLDTTSSRDPHRPALNHDLVPHSPLDSSVAALFGEEDRRSRVGRGRSSTGKGSREASASEGDPNRAGS